MGRSFRHWTPRYVADRIGVMIYANLNPDAPWLTRQAVEILDDWIRERDCGVEWGSGRSTIWLAHRVERLISIEHDAEWYEKVRSQLEEDKLKNVEYHYAEVKYPDAAPDISRYLEAARKEPESSVDFVLVDGILRDHCAELAVGLLKPGGLLVIDNSNWYLPFPSRSPKSVGENGTPSSERWKEVFSKIRKWRHIWTSNGVTDTAFFVKPDGD